MLVRPHRMRLDRHMSGVSPYGAVMIESDDWAVFDSAYDLAIRYMKDLDSRPVDAASGPGEIVDAALAELPLSGESAESVIRELSALFEPGLVASAGGRFFGWVTGGTYPVGVAADWLTSAWDQLSGPAPASPAANAADVIVGRWITDLLGLPRQSMTGLVTGTQMANFRRSGGRPSRSTIPVRMERRTARPRRRTGPDRHCRTRPSRHDRYRTALPRTRYRLHSRRRL